MELRGVRALVTGASAGIGRECAIDLARRGAHVVLATRSAEKTAPVRAQIEALGAGGAEHLPIDLGDLRSVQRAVRLLRERGEPLHVLLNNAGIVGEHGLSPQGFEIAFATNHLGHFLLTNGVLDLLRAGAAQRGVVSRVVDVASKAHVNASRIDWSALQARTATRTGWREYAVSKLCNVLHARELAARLGRGSVQSYSLHPGIIASDLWRQVPWPFRRLLTFAMSDNADGAKTSLWCCTAAALEQQSGRYYDGCRERVPSALGQDDALARELWTRSETWVAPFVD